MLEPERTPQIGSLLRFSIDQLLAVELFTFQSCFPVNNLRGQNSSRTHVRRMATMQTPYTELPSRPSENFNGDLPKGIVTCNGTDLQYRTASTNYVNDFSVPVCTSRSLSESMCYFCSRYVKNLANRKKKCGEIYNINS